MTLIVKELIVRGIVSSENSSFGEFSSEKEDLSQYLEQLKKEIEKDCLERIMQKLETKTVR
ncbi:DUF5908 family protein [Mariniphaga sp.]|uniref:DUF5908 family protein n=1 Tax=Mariniphaga sp. TaxID=1954475 RepID=UPI0035619629